MTYLLAFLLMAGASAPPASPEESPLMACADRGVRYYRALGHVGVFQSGVHKFNKVHTIALLQCMRSANSDALFQCQSKDPNDC